MQGNIAGTKRLSLLPKFVQAWIAFTSPAASRQPQWREEIASLIFPIIFLLVVLPLPAALGNPPQLITLSIILPVMLIALLLKKLGYFLIAGFLIAGGIECGIASAIVTVAGGVDISQLPLYALLIQTGFVVIAFFSPGWIWGIAVINCSFIVFSILNLHRPGTALALQLTQDPAAVLVPMILLQLFVAFVCWVIMEALLREILRADRAEVIADLERREVDHQHEELQRKQQIEEGVQVIIQTMNQAASGNLGARAPLAQENILWRVAQTLNTLLARLQALRQDQDELARTREIAQRLAQCVSQGRAFPLQRWTKTPLDPVIMAYNQAFSGPQSPSSHQTHSTRSNQGSVF
jgi:hypothetical protein